MLVAFDELPMMKVKIYFLRTIFALVQHLYKMKS